MSLLLTTATLNSAAFAQPSRVPQSGQQIVTTQQDPSTTQSPVSAPAPSGILADSEKDYLISAGDVIEIQIADAPELSRYYRVNAQGSFEMQVIGRVAARGQSTEELARTIAKGLRDQEYLKDPNVVVIVRQYNSQTFFVQGSVNRPGVYQVEGSPSLLMMIGMAGGLNDNHGSTAFIIRSVRQPKPAEQPTTSAPAPPVKPAPTAVPTEPAKQPESTKPPESATTSPESTKQSDAAQDQSRTQTGSAQTVSTQTASIDSGAPATAPDADPQPEYELLRVNLSALYRGHFEQNQKLQPGDIINVPRADVFFVAGEVQAPGSFQLKDGTTLRQAISLAQGMTFKSKPGDGIIFREDPESGKRQEIKVDISAVMNGKTDDIPVLANDVIIVPNSRTKSVGGALLMAFGLNTARVPLRY